MIKTSLLSLFLICSFSIVYSQQKKDTSKTYRNEFGIDATSFLLLYLPLGQDYNYLPNYYLTYRRKFNSGNIRSGLGGDFSNQNVGNTNYPNDSTKYNRFNYGVDFRIGWEFVNEISKRWQVYYGLDTKISYQHIKNDLNYFSSGYAYGSESNYNTFGISPVLGFRFRLNKRLSLTTETNLSINWSKSSRREYYTPYISGLPAIPDEITPSDVRIYSQFSQPLTIIFTYDI
jgi:hypothetical protein